MAAENENNKRKIVLKIKTEDETRFRQVFMEAYPKTAPEDLDKYVKYALAEGKPEDEGGLQWPDLDEEGQKREYDLVNNWNIGKVTANPPIVEEKKAEEQSGQPKDESKTEESQSEKPVDPVQPKTEEKPSPTESSAEEVKTEAEKPADEVIATPPPQSKTETEKPADEVENITLLRGSVKIIDPVMIILDSFFDKKIATKIGIALLEEGKATISVPVGKKDELLSGLKSVGIEMEKPGMDMAEIVLVGYEKSKFIQIITACSGFFIDPRELPKILDRFDSGEKQIPVMVPKDREDEAKETFATAGLHVLVPGPIGDTVESDAIETPITLDDVKKAIEDLKATVEAIPKPETDDTQKRSLQDLLSQVAALAARIPEKPLAPVVNLSPLSTQILATDAKVEELRSKVLGEKDKDGRWIPGMLADVSGGVDVQGEKIFSLREKISGVCKKTRSAIWWGKLSCAVGACLFIVALIILISVKMAPTPKIDPTALKTAVSAAMPTSTTIAAEVANALVIPSATDIVTEMKKQGLVVPQQSQGKPAAQKGIILK